ncbi:GNAT family N-acetyltransferase [Tateyamaria sp.]|uniref:GNAT family N-acetyltransferase n=1 Tax=Tateyamaria sp. TaxID=1929288 RepID=UPI003B21217F
MEVRRTTRADLDVIMGAPHLFDAPPDPDRTAEMLDDPRHHLFLALSMGDPVGFLSAVDYIHPDKPRAMWINELGVLETARRRSVATRLTAEASAHAQTIGCTEIWVLADPTHEALGFYASLSWAREGDHIAMFTKALT